MDNSIVLIVFLVAVVLLVVFISQNMNNGGGSTSDGSLNGQPCPSGKGQYDICEAKWLCADVLNRGAVCRLNEQCTSGKCNDIKPRDGYFCPTGLCS